MRDRFDGERVAIGTFLLVIKVCLALPHRQIRFSILQLNDHRKVPLGSAFKPESCSASVPRATSSAASEALTGALPMCRPVLTARAALPLTSNQNVDRHLEIRFCGWRHPVIPG